MKSPGTFIATAVLAAALQPTAHADGREPGSVLIFPIHRSGQGLFTVVNVTNTNLLPANQFTYGGSTNVHFEYVNTVPNPKKPLLPWACAVIDRIELLTPADTRSVLTACHNASGAMSEEGYLVVSAQDPNQFDTPWSHDYLVGSELVVNGMGAMYALNAIPFDSAQPEGQATDVDGDGELDFDGVEYEGVPDHLFIDSFAALGGSSLTLLNLTGGAAFTANVQFDVWNDNEFPLSATLAFRCWMEEALSDISLVMYEGFLANNTPNDPAEADIDCDGVGDIETGWARLRGLVANSVAESIPNPALLGAITVGDSFPSMPAVMLDGGHLLWESEAVQLNGDFFKYGTEDPEH